MKKEMLINAGQPEECRIAIVEDGVLEELYVERASQESYVGNIYKGKIVNIEPSIQAAFVDFGVGRNGFLHVSDVDPVYYKHLLPKHVVAELEAEEEAEFGGNRGGGGRRGDRGDRRDRDRGPRREERPAAPKQLTSWLDDDQTAAPAAGLADEDSGFGSGLDAEADAPPPAPAKPARPAAPPPPPAAKKPAPAEPDEDSGFGAGLDFEDDEPAGTGEEIVELEVVQESTETADGFEVRGAAFLKYAPAEPDKGLVGPITTENDTVAGEQRLKIDPADPEAFANPPGEDEEKPAGEKKPKPRARRPKKADDAPAAEGDDGAKAKGRTRKPKKKADGDEPADDADGDAPKFMPGAERRTGPADEPEIDGFGFGLDDDAPAAERSEPAREPSAEAPEEAAADDAADTETAAPFFGGDGDEEFDVDAPNDRFGGQPAKPDRDDRRGGKKRKPEPVAAADEDEDDAEEDEGAPPASVFADEDDEFAGDEIPVPRLRDEEGRGGRGGRGDRGRRRDGDRGDRRGGDRGGKPGGGGGGRPPRDKGYPRLPIEQIFKRGQEVIVQVIKEGIGTKGPTLSTYISIAGRYLVLMPSLNRVGVSRKIEDHDARRRLRDTMNAMNPPKGVGFIVRTAAVDREPKELQNDMAYLLRLWQVMVRRIKKQSGPLEIYRESDMITRTIRDIFTKDVDSILVDDPQAFEHAKEFLQVVMPRFADRIKLHDDTLPLFHKHRIEEEIAKLNQKRIEMPQGGSIIIEQTEALVAIDVNSGTFRAENNAEETAYRMNLLAAKEIARQLRLRDLGGVIVNDFIDMRDEKHRREVENTLRNALRRDRARTKILRISQFGIIEMTRQRMQQSLKKRIYNDCPHCKGTGYVKTGETLAIDAMRLLQMAAHRAQTGTPAVSAVRLTVCQDAAYYLLNRKRREIAALEDRAKVEVTVTGLPGVSPDHLEFKCFDPNGNEVRLLNQGPPPKLFQPGGRPPQRLPDRRPQRLD